MYQILDSVFNNGKKIAGLGMHWRIFGSSEYIKKPSGLVIESYLRRAKDDFSVNGHIKSICNPRMCSGINNPHMPKYAVGYYCVNDSNEIIQEAIKLPPSYQKIWVNHYFCKSYEEWERKLKRGKADCYEIREQKEFDFHDRNEIFDNGMMKYVEEVKKNMY